ncbi:MAG: hypothetical protein JNM14_16665, partial [Ferruginibacter sp.]|nr:hypothetical protein [Ferruginibacter sp.]
ASGKLNRGLLPEPAVVAGQDHVAPSTEVERRLLRLWAEVLKVDESVIGVHSNFFEMGGHSISATKLLHNVQRSFKAYDFSLSDIFKNPSISAIANKLKQKWIGTGNPMDTSLIRLNNCEDPKGNLFFIHDGTGDIQGYNELVALLPDYNCWGLRWPDFERLSPGQLTMADISARHIENIKLVQPEGSYRIIGWSYGGIIAYDMLLELEKKGKDVHSLVMIDTVTSKNQMAENTKTEPEFSLESEKELIVECMGEEELGVAGIASVEDLWQSVKLAIDRNPGLRENIRQYLPDNILQLVPNFDAVSSEEMISSLNTVRTLRHLVSKYKMQGSLNAKLHYVKAANTEFNHNMLSDFFDNNIALSILPGDHFSILKSPVVKDISKIIASV